MADTLRPVRVNPVVVHPAEQRVSLDGEWRFRLDPEERGQREEWFHDNGVLVDSILVPGCWQGQGYGHTGKDSLWDFRLEARTYRATYSGTGWYGRAFTVPSGWVGQRVWLLLGGVHPSAEVWLNGQRVCENGLPFVPFGADVTGAIRVGEPNWVAVRVHEHNRILGLAYNWQGNWSGLYRGVELRATGETAIHWLTALGDVPTETIRVSVFLDGWRPEAETLTLSVAATSLHDDEVSAQAEFPLDAPEMVCELRVPSPRLWSPDSPALYRVDAVLRRGDVVLDAWSERTGFVTFDTEGQHFKINGEPYYMRGSGDFLSCPETGCPDTDRERWRRKLQTLRDYGYNYVRCQSYVYGPEYYDVADEVGLLVQSEMGMLGAWSGHSQWHVYPWPQPTPGYHAALKQQWDLTVLRDASHPSANLYCMSNELYDYTAFRRTAWQCYHSTKAIKPTALVIYSDGGRHPDMPLDFINAEAQVSQEEHVGRPVIQHEFRWWSSYPDVRQRERYCGAMRPYGADLALEAAAEHGIAHVLPEAAAMSQRLQFVEAKGKMEACRRDFPQLAGICHFNAMDANPSPQGVLTEFYEPKVVDAATWRETNGDTVVLSSLGFDDRVFTGGQTFRCTLYVSDYSHPPLQSPLLEWRVVCGQRIEARGQLSYEHRPFTTCPAGCVEALLPEVQRAVPAGLEVTLHEGDRTFTNRWDLWLFPEVSPLPKGVARYGGAEHTWLRTLEGVRAVVAEELNPGHVRAVLTERLDQALVAYMTDGGRVILAASEGLTRPFMPKFGFTLGHYYFTPPANYPPYEDGHDGTIIARHPMLGDLPHEGFADLHFFRMIANSPSLDLEPLGLTGADPVIRVMHSYPVCRPLGYLLEAQYGGGGLIVTALELNQEWPEARYLLARILEYAVAHGFAPSIVLTPAALKALLYAGQIP